MQRRRWTAAILLFPVLVMGNWFVMARSRARIPAIGVPAGLLNRAATGAYCVVVLWSVAAKRLVVSTRARTAALVAVALALFGVKVASLNFQIYPAWKSYANDADVNPAPPHFVKAGEYVRRHAGSPDVIQDVGPTRAPP